MDMYQEANAREHLRFEARKALRKYIRATGIQMTPDQQREWLRQWVRKAVR